LSTLSIYLTEEFGDCRVKEFIKEQVIDIPFARTPAPIPSPAVMGLTGPAAALAGLI
jgi:hypothetical protein